MMIGLCGFAGSGKDTVGQIILAHWKKIGLKGFRLSFADALKEDLLPAYKRLCLNRPKGMSDQTFKNKVRPLWVCYGTEVGRALNPEIWINGLKESKSSLDKNRCNGEEYHYVVTDVRNLNEMLYILNESPENKILYISREGYEGSDETERNSINEILDYAEAIENKELSRFSIIPNNADLYSLQTCVTAYLQKEA